MTESVAVIGAGVSGLTAAYLLTQRYDVTLFEAEPRLGGHAHTHDITDPAGRPLAIDTGFIVHNDRTYPLLRRLFAELGVQARPTEMSMSISDPASGLEFAGGRGAAGLFAQRRRLVDARFLSLLTEVRRFHQRAADYIARTGDDDLTTLGDFLTAEGFSQRFVRLYAVPVVSCVWSCGGRSALEYPARYLFRFLDHHGMLSIGGSPQWMTVTGGSRQYVDAVAAKLGPVRSGTPVRSVQRHPDGVSLAVANGDIVEFDRVVLAAHADQALDLLTDATPTEKTVLGAFEYSQNATVLHTDDSLLPATKGARASWNYVIRPGAPLTTYWMNRLQGLDTDETYLVTLNGAETVDPAKVLARMNYAHPVYTPEAVAAQRRLPTLNRGRTAFAGAYHGWGFHEDGCRAGVAAAAALGVAW
ncbi:FAD-dependent oxidoreductase [Kribbella sandramycini]|uniref:FAD-dependent oxidoreductase n=1 Tax=Kribbella sandramycini TaxID=60450 RepID=A0A7Y4L457_9ACTN|nr:FAD-dependent oxidoreductase [Kribbella sandramycini]MBB6570887.1 putative NAD/FAD-binding protein [Kribbella sandramycini]NOL44018.1 FAD-dependent oxidoreductase [Kribbella sandramycini]